MNIGGWNKFGIDKIFDYCTQHNIEFLDEIYVNNAYNHRWKCGTCGTTTIQALSKIKRANGMLKCCSRVSTKNLNECDIYKERFKLSVNNLEFKHIQQHLEWICLKHAQPFKYNIATMRKIKESPCPLCREEHKQKHLENIVNSIKEATGGNIVLVDNHILGLAHTHRWYCNKHDYTTTSRASIILKTNRLKCCRFEEITGPNHPEYNHDLNDSQRIKDRRYGKYKEWSRSVRVRDKWRCKICNKNSGCIAHHLNSYTKYPEQRYDISNGVTMCKSCHISFHKIYGRITTLDDYNEFRFLNSP